MLSGLEVDKLTGSAIGPAHGSVRARSTLGRDEYTVVRQPWGIIGSSFSNRHWTLAFAACRSVERRPGLFSKRLTAETSGGVQWALTGDRFLLEAIQSDYVAYQARPYEGHAQLIASERDFWEPRLAKQAQLVSSHYALVFDRRDDVPARGAVPAIAFISTMGVLWGAVDGTDSHAAVMWEAVGDWDTRLDKHGTYFGVLTGHGEVGFLTDPNAAGRLRDATAEHFQPL